VPSPSNYSTLEIIQLRQIRNMSKLLTPTTNLVQRLAPGGAMMAYVREQLGERSLSDAQPGETRQFIQQWLRMDESSRKPYLPSNKAVTATVPPTPTNSPTLVSQPAPRPPAVTVPGPKSDPGWKTFSLDSEVLRLTTGPDTVVDRWNSLDVVARLGWQRLEDSGGKAKGRAKTKTATAPPTPVLTEQQEAVLSPLRRHLAALRVTAFIRVQHRMMRDVQRSALEVYRELGWGWNEKAYQEAIKMELDQLGYRVTSEITHTIYYKGRPMGDGVNVRSDILVEDRTTGRQLLLELKAVPASNSTMEKAVQQCRRYLKLKKYPSGMVVNFPSGGGERVRMVHVVC